MPFLPALSRKNHSRTGMRAPETGGILSISYRAGINRFTMLFNVVLFPDGNTMRFSMTAEAFGEFVRNRRKELKMNQIELAIVSGTGVRFISDLENGKRSCELGKALDVLANLGIELTFRRRTEV
jgi:HTH-type transcriptional regulator/antitoxin HipB